MGRQTKRKRHIAKLAAANRAKGSTTAAVMKGMSSSSTKFSKLLTGRQKRTIPATNTRKTVAPKKTQSLSVQFVFSNSNREKKGVIAYKTFKKRTPKKALKKPAKEQNVAGLKSSVKKCKVVFRAFKF